MKRPYRSPIEVPELLKDHIKDKVVCEIGCADGDLLPGFAKYAEKVIGVEFVEDCWIKLREVESKSDNIEILYGGVRHKREGKAGTRRPFNHHPEIPLPEADLYFVWINRPVCEAFLDRIQKGKIVIGTACVSEKGEKWLKSALNKYEGTKEYIKFIPKETDHSFRLRVKGEGIYTEKTPLMLGILNKR